MPDTPRLPVPPGACDTHMHIYGPVARYTLAATAARPPPFHADLAAWRTVLARLGLTRTVVVQPSAYGADNACTLDAVAALGDAARAVVVVTPQTPDAELHRLHAAGARGARFFMMQGAPQGWDALAPVAARIAPLGWHVQLQFDGTEMPQQETAIRALPCRVVIDHVGRFHPPVPPDRPQVRSLLRLLETGRVWVKASAPYNTSLTGPPHYDDVTAIARAAIGVAPDRILWASNWPHPNPPDYPIEEAGLLDLLGHWAPDDATRRRILVDNPAALYGWA
jgi:D-galactarolactone isomerase